MDWKERKDCRVCGGRLTEVFDLGELYPSAFVDNSETLVKVPLTLVQCDKCNLVQLKHTINQDLLYRQYWYKSGLNQTMVTALEDIAENIKKKIELKAGDVVLDIGTNDATLLKFFDGMIKVGIDPAQNLQIEAEKHCIFINDYFDAETYLTLELPKPRVVTTIAMFYDLENPNEFVSGVKEILAPDGIWVIQLTDLVSMLKLNAFDNICHEHLEYFSLGTISNLLTKHGLDIFDVGHNKVNGGSLRVYVCHSQTRPIETRVKQARLIETTYMYTYYDPFAAFKYRIETARECVVGFIKAEVELGRKVFVLGASTKGNSLLQTFGIDSTLIPYALEVNKEKFGKRTGGTNIKIIPEANGLAMKPDYLLCLPYHFKEFFIEVNKDFIDAGGGLIFPLPSPEVVTKLGARSLCPQFRFLTGG